MRWQKAMWDAVGRCDQELIRDILSLDEVQCWLQKSEQVYLDEEAPLHLAAFCGYNDLLSLMITAGMDLDSFNIYTDKSGFKVTPLHWATYKNKVGTVKLLLSLGADPHLKGKWGRLKGTPLDFAKAKKYKEIIDMLSHPQEVLLHDEADQAVHERDIRQELDEKRIQRKALAFDLRQLDRDIVDLQLQVGGGSAEAGHAQESRPNCVMCHNVPHFKAFSCQDCQALFCNGCRFKTDECPQCQTSFTSQGPPRRNSWAERYIQLYRKAK